LKYFFDGLGPFLYKPKAKVQVNAMDTPVAHVSVRVPYVLRVTVENPLDLPLTLRKLELRTDSLEIKSEVLSEIVLPPLSKKSVFSTLFDLVLIYVLLFYCLVSYFLLEMNLT
jgi:LEA14-like dessication related protein